MDPTVKPSEQQRISRRNTQDGREEEGVPITKTIVGFHVDGASPSPATEALLAKEAGRASFTGGEGGGSPTPVIIPPTFQVRQASLLLLLLLPQMMTVACAVAI